MTAMFIIFSTEDINKNELYSNWTFPTPESFDKFWFDENSTQFLYHSVDYIVGTNQMAIGKLRVVPEIKIYKNRDPGVVILGITISFKDR